LGIHHIFPLLFFVFDSAQPTSRDVFEPVVGTSRQRDPHAKQLGLSPSFRNDFGYVFLVTKNSSLVIYAHDLDETLSPTKKLMQHLLGPFSCLEENGYCSCAWGPRVHPKGNACSTALRLAP
jgi:hypothetical protein